MARGEAAAFGILLVVQAGRDLPPVAVVGAGGHAREVHDLLDACERQLLGFFADGHADHALIEERGARVLGPVADLDRQPSHVEYVIAIGSGAARRRIDTALAPRTAAVLVHPGAVLGGFRVELGAGSLLFPGVVITTNVTLGRHVHLNARSSVSHDSRLQDYVTVGPGCCIAGNVVVETGATLGTASCVIPHVTIGAGAVIGAGAAVVRDVPAGVTAVGVPARPR